jgi:3-oxoacyl-[acyl-carrier protein] reductase
LKYFSPAGGSVVNVSSLVSTLAPPNASVYSATKGAVDVITGSLAKELGARKIRVNAVRPGLVETEGARTSGFTSGDFHDQYVKHAPLGRIGQPQDIATAVGFLASDDASWITGETLLVSGGHR